MSIDPVLMFVSLVPGGIGFVLFVYGRKQGRWPHMVAGLAFMAYPYFASTLTVLVAIGGMIGGGLWYALRMGW
jgi:hypothetical protein